MLPPSPSDVKELYLSDAVPVPFANTTVSAAVSTFPEASEMGTSHTEASVVAGSSGSATGILAELAVPANVPSEDSEMTNAE